MLKLLLTQREDFMNSIRETYKQNLQDYQHHSIIKASTWTYCTLLDFRSSTKKSNTLTLADRIAIFFRGIVGALAHLPIKLIAIPYTLAIGAVHKKTQKFPPMQQLHAIIPGLYLGSAQAAQNETLLKTHGITAVLSVIDYEIKVPKNQVSNHAWLVLKDDPDADIAPVAEKALEFVQEAHKNNQNVLVHCYMGKSRSASIMIKLVQKLNNMAPAEAIAYVKSKRPIVAPNYGFKQQILRSAV